MEQTRTYKGWVPITGKVLVTYTGNTNTEEENDHFRVLNGLTSGADTVGKIMNGTLKDFEFISVGDEKDIDLISVIEDEHNDNTDIN